MIRFRIEAEIWGREEELKMENILRNLVSCEGEKKPPRQVLGYRLSAGLWIFYATVPVVKEGLKRGLIDLPEEKVPRAQLDDMRTHIGMRLYEILPEAFQNTTCDELAAALEQVNRGPTRVLIQVYDAWRERREGLEEGWTYLMEELELDLAARKVLSYQIPSKEECFEYCYFAIFRRARSYEECLEALAHRVYRDYQNSGDLYEAYKDNDFYDIDRFLQRLYRFAFIFDAKQKGEGLEE